MTYVSQDPLLSPHLALNGIFTGTGAGAGLAGLLAPEDLESEEGVGSAPVLPGLTNQRRLLTVLTHQRRVLTVLTNERRVSILFTYERRVLTELTNKRVFKCFN